MTADRRQPIEMPPRLLCKESAAAYVGLSPNAFEAEVAAGTFPEAFRLRTVRRALWDVRALDRALDRISGIEVGEDDWATREQRWAERRQGRSQAAR